MQKYRLKKVFCETKWKINFFRRKKGLSCVKPIEQIPFQNNLFMYETKWKKTFFERRTFIFWGCWFSFAWFNRVKKSWVFFLNIIPSIFFRKRSHGNFIPKTFFSCVRTEEKNCEKKFKNVLFVFFYFFGRFFSVFMIKTERKNIFRGNSFLFPVWDKMKKNIFFMCETKGKKEKWEIKEKYWEKISF